MTIAVAEGITDALATEHRSGFRRRWYRTPAFVAGILIVGTVIAVALAAPAAHELQPRTSRI